MSSNNWFLQVDDQKFVRDVPKLITGARGEWFFHKINHISKTSIPAKMRRTMLARSAEAF